MLEKLIALTIIFVGLFAGVLQTTYRLAVRKFSRTKYDGNWTWPRGMFGDLSVSSTAYLVAAVEFFNFPGANTPTRIIGYCIILMGISLRIWSQLSLGLNWSTGVSIRDDHTLVTNGPYRFIRHPMYTGFFLMAIGIICATHSLAILLFWIIFLTLTLKRSFLEEKVLESRFGIIYQQYKLQTGMFLPKIHPGKEN